MAIRQIRQKGDEILSKRSKVVDLIDDKIKVLSADMLDTMYANDGIGLAACQVGMLKRIIVYDTEYFEEGKKPKPVVMVNPVITSRSKAMIVVEEGCLSFPNIFEDVKRHAKITVEYQDLEGNKRVKHAKDIEAVVIQHETDHLDGVVFLDRIKDQK